MDSMGKNKESAVMWLHLVWMAHQPKSSELALSISLYDLTTANAKFSVQRF